jgi:signal transduction histidine kinase
MLEMMKGAVQKLNTTIEDLIQILVVKNNVNPQLTSLGLEEVFNQVLPTFTNALSEVGGKVITNFQSSFVLLNKVFLESIFINLISMLSSIVLRSGIFLYGWKAPRTKLVA